MAVIKFFKGLAKNLNTMNAHEGYVYFTPDDGKMYIDVEDSVTPTIGNASSTGNRVCINEWQGVTTLDGGDASTT